jgi:site-specific DNA recombinase
MDLINALTFKMDHSMGALQMLKERRVRRTLPRRNMKGWVCHETSYDDGGWSGGTIERPALRRFMTDIKASRIKIIVVFKIDRLTRSLTDFTKLVEIFDEYGVTFVSVTQQVNTTTSMGRLTLNVLLSFAQYEREITGERIPDKCVASKAKAKAKGMVMGDKVPIG